VGVLKRERERGVLLLILRISYNLANGCIMDEVKLHCSKERERGGSTHKITKVKAHHTEYVYTQV